MNKEHPIYMSPSDWCNSNYFKEYSGGKKHQLFDKELNRRVNDSALFPIYPLNHYIFQVDYEGNCYQSYDCKESKTSWVYAKVIDHSRDLTLKSADELNAQQKAYNKYSTYQAPTALLKKYGIDLEVISSAGDKCHRSSLTHQEWLTITADKDYVENKKPPFTGITLEVPHIEMPVKIYVAGCDDASYTALYDRVESAFEVIDQWKINGVPAYPSGVWKGGVFTN